MKRAGPTGARLLAASIAVVIAAAALVFWIDPIDVDDRPNVSRVMKMIAASVRADLIAELESRSLALQRLAGMGMRPGVSQADWQEAAELFLANHPGYLSVELHPLGGDDRSPGPLRSARRRGIDDATLVAAEHSKLLREQTQAILLNGEQEGVAIAPVRLRSGKAGYLLAVPGTAGARPESVLLALLDVEGVVDHMFADHADLGYSIAIHQDGAEVYRTGGVDDAQRDDWARRVPLRLSRLNLEIEVWPHPELLAALRSRLPELAALVTLVLGLLLATTAHFAQTRHESALELRVVRDQLQVLVAERTAELQHLSGRMMYLQDAERRRIARELHDSFGQVLGALRMSLGRLRQQAPEDAKLRAILDDADKLVRQGISEVRTVSYLLHPAVLDELGLASALEEYVAGFRERSGIDVRLQLPPDQRRLAPELELCVFRVVQEALGNVHRHSGSSTAQIELADEGARVRVRVADQGRGLAADAAQPALDKAARGIGIASMRERVRELGGTLELRPREGGGTIVEVVLPVVDPGRSG